MAEETDFALKSMSYIRPMRPSIAAWLALALALAAPAPGAPPDGKEPPAFARIKELAGAWSGEEDDGSPCWVRYQVVADGAALLEELRMGDAPSMTSIYYPDGDQVMMTHYCLTSSQPRLRTVSIPGDLSELEFKYVDASNVMNSTGGMMDALRIRFQGPDRFEQLWGASSTMEPPVRVRYRRVPEEELVTSPSVPVEATDGAAGQALARLAGYAGEWVGTGEGGFQVGWTLEPISGGTALLETLELAPGQTMLTVYHVDGDRLMLTHYCHSWTQPRMQASVIPEPLTHLEFEAMDATNVLVSTAAFMRTMRWDLSAPDRFRQTWNQAAVGLQPMPLDFRRGRPTEGAFAAEGAPGGR